MTALKPSADPLDNAVSRVAGLQDHAGSAAGNLESYTYLGLDTIVQRTRGNGINLSYIQQTGDSTPPPSTSPGGDRYTGLDAFGRVIDQPWFSAGNINSPKDRLQYAYDRDSNVLHKNMVGQGTNA